MNPLTKKTTQGPTEHRTLKIFSPQVFFFLSIPRDSDSRFSPRCLFGCLGTDSGAICHYSAATDPG